MATLVIQTPNCKEDKAPPRRRWIPHMLIMSNSLTLAKEWGGYNPSAKSIAPPTPIENR